MTRLVFSSGLRMYIVVPPIPLYTCNLPIFPFILSLALTATYGHITGTSLGVLTERHPDRRADRDRGSGAIHPNPGTFSPLGRLGRIPNPFLHPGYDASQRLHDPDHVR